MSRFKIGDKVTVTNHNVHPRSRKDTLSIGDSFVIGSFNECTPSLKYKYVYFPEMGNGFFDTEIELEAVYSSPLYQALL